jgi:hypothetical protein
MITICATCKEQGRENILINDGIEDGKISEGICRRHLQEQLRKLKQKKGVTTWQNLRSTVSRLTAKS